MPRNAFFAVWLVGVSLAQGWLSLFAPVAMAALALSATAARKKPKGPLRCVIYCRISRDRKTEVSMAVQEADCRKYAELKGWVVVGVYRDRGEGAWKRTTPRPAFERMLRDIDAGGVDVLCFWKLDRLSRGVLELAAVAKRLKAKNCDLASLHDSIDTSSPGGRFMFIVLAALAELESEQISLRVTASAGERAKNGKANGGGSRPYGYEEDRRTIRKAEKKLILEAARRILAGEALAAIAKDWNERKVPLPSDKGRQWWPAGIARVVLNGHVCGLRMFDGEEFRGNWPAIISPEMREQLKERLADPHNRTGTYTHQLLSGILYCSSCGMRMSGTGKVGSKNAQYRCRRDNFYKGCGHCHVATGPLERHIRGLVFVALTDPEFRRVMQSGRDLEDLETLQAEIDDIQDRLRALSADFGKRDITHAEWQAARQPLNDELEAKQTELRGAEVAAAPDAPDVPSTIPELEVWWAGADQLDRRALVRGVIARIDVGPATRSGPFEPSRVKVTPRT